ncbi:MAG: IPT/TIG domain-containing protein [Planctomycetota bacterium]
MKTTIRTCVAASGLALALTALGSLALPTGTAAFSVIGGNLSTSQRDFRVFNNFSDTQANNNTTPHANFPGHTGAVMAIWKGHVEWASGPYAGNGLGDGLSSNVNLGDGGANFDNTFQGLATSAGGSNGNVHSEEAGSSGSTLAYTQTPISDGWTIRYLSSWTWQDGPGTVSSGIDLQGVACHEIGHSLGLGHTSVSGSTMTPAISGTGTGQRSIGSDDIAGVQSIYGVKSASKPTITGIVGTKAIGSSLTINGSNFSATGNEVWFTKSSSDGNPTKVTGVASSGTSLTVTIPGGVVDGEVLVKGNFSGHSSLSNAWPIDVGAPSGDAPTLSGVSPTLGPSGGFTVVALTGTGFTGVHTVMFGAVPAASFVVNSGTSITAESPPGTIFTVVSVSVTDSEGSSSLPNAFSYTFNPAPSISSVSPNSGPIEGGTEVTITGASVIGVTSVTFDGVAGTDLAVLDATTLVVTTPAGAIGPANVTATGAGSSTITGGFTYVDGGEFIDIGPGKAGGFGAPVLTGSGDLSAGSVTGFSLIATGAFSFAPATLYVSLTQGAVPFKDGTFYPIPILTQIPLAMSVVGDLNLASSMPAGTPSGLAIVLQLWISDPSASFGLSATNGLKLVVP